MPIFNEFSWGSAESLCLLAKTEKITVTFGTPLLASDTDFSKKPARIDDDQYFANILRERVLALKR